MVDKDISDYNRNIRQLSSYDFNDLKSYGFKAFMYLYFKANTF